LDAARNEEMTVGDGKPEPYLSIVATARNDDHRGGFLRRMQIFVSGVLEQCRRHNLPAELILVEWNPPPDRPRLAEALQWPVRDGPCSVRVIEVPPELHRRFKYSDKLPLFQMIAKNVGLRRARGRFVLATCVDLLFSDELVRFLASRHLKDNCMYRIDRHDVPAEVPAQAGFDEQLEYCRRNILRVNAKGGTFLPGETQTARWLSVNLRQSVWKRLRVQWLIDKITPRLPPSFRLGLLKEPVALGHYVWEWCRFLKSLFTVLMSWPERIRSKARLARGKLRLPNIHTNACGDFTLLSRERWLQLRGYPEFEVYPIYLDNLFCQMAHLEGIKEVILGGKMRLYHIEHASGATRDQIGELKRKMNELGIPMLDKALLCQWVASRGGRKTAPVFNDENWGVGREQLKETRIESVAEGCSPKPSGCCASAEKTVASEYLSEGDLHVRASPR